MWTKKTGFFIIFIFGQVSLLLGQGSTVPFDWDKLSNEYQVRNFVVKDGLPLNSINYIVHHTDGYVYMATNDGLSRFDGTQFVTFNTANSPKMQSNRIAWVGSGANEELWFSDAAENMYRFRGGEIDWLQEKTPYKSLKVKKIELYKEDRILVTTDKGFFKQVSGEMKFIPFNDPRTQVEFDNSFIFGREDIYFLNQEGFFKMREGKVSLLISKEDMLMPFDDVFNMIVTNDGVEWLLGMNGQLLELGTNAKQKLHTSQLLGNANIWDFKEVSDNELLLSTNRGYVLFDRRTGLFIDNGQMAINEEEYFEDNGWAWETSRLVTRIKNSIYIDGRKVLETGKSIPFLTTGSDGSIWVATNGEGVYQILRKKFVTIGDNLSQGLVNVYGLEEENGNVWAASFEGNIFRISDNEIRNWNRENSGLDFIYYRSVYESKSGAIFAGNFDTWKYEAGRWALYPENQLTGQVNVFFEDSKNRFWVGKDIGLYQIFGDSTGRFLGVDGTEISRVTGIQELENNDLFFLTTQSGLAILDQEDRFSFLDTEDGLTSNLIRDLYMPSNDTLWVVTEDKGLNRVIIDSGYNALEVKELSTADGLIDNSLHRLIEDRFGYFWINSNKGIMRIKESILNDFLDQGITELNVESFGEEDGLENREGNGGVQYAGLLTEDGKLLFPSQAGIVYTKPEWHLTNQRKLIPPIVEAVSYEDTSEYFFNRSEITLPNSVRDIQIKFSIPSFTTPEKLILEYKMEGVNTDWQKVGSERLAVLTNLPAGDYSFSMRGKIAGNEEFVRNEITINVTPYFYETVWFFGVSVILFGLLVFLGIRLLLIQGKRREERLNRLVEERTVELLEEKEKTELALQQVKKLDQSKSQFFTNFTHELRTPLSLILNPLEDMLEEDGFQVSNPKKRNSLTLMKRNATRLKELINQLLDVSKLNSGELTLFFEPVDLFKLTHRIVTQFEDSLAKKEIQLKLIESEDLELIYVDVNAWEHIITNLLSNALKFTSQKGGICFKVEEEKEDVIVRVYDTGSGIPKKDMPYIFDSYYQGDSSISRAGGTGIGLALVKGLVEKMGGTIEVESTVEIGTQFIIHLKKGSSHISSKDRIKASSTISIPAEKSTDNIVLSDSRSTNESIKTLFTQKVLLVEDNEDFREYLSSVIGDEYEVQVAQNGQEGLDLLKVFSPDIVVSDIMMPIMNGYEMMKSIRKMEEYKSIPFIFLSAKNSVADIEKGLNVGADIYLPKPVQNSVLLTQIKVLLRREGLILKEEQKKEDKRQSQLIRNVHEIIQRHLGNPELNVELIARALSISSPSLYRNWKKENQESINKTITRLRFEEALKLIEEGFSISEVSYSVGFNHLSYFSKAFKKAYGVSPQEYVKKRMAV